MLYSDASVGILVALDGDFGCVLRLLLSVEILSLYLRGVIVVIFLGVSFGKLYY